MARTPRVHLRGGLYHVMRGATAGRRSSSPTTSAVTPIQEAVERFGHRIRGFCLMTKHLHLSAARGEGGGIRPVDEA